MAGKNILVFTLDSKGIRICESSNYYVNRKHRKQLLNTKIKSCTTADFFSEHLLPIINNLNPSMLFFVTSNESSVQSYFHTDLLKNVLTENSYTRLKYTSLTKTDLNSLNVSLYVRSADEDQYIEGKKMRYSIHSERFGYGKYGALGIRFTTINNNVKKSYCFVGISFPDDQDEYSISRAQKLLYLSTVYKNIIKDSRGIKPDNLILAGNFGYLLDNHEDISDYDMNALLGMDYITAEKKTPSSMFYGLKEGVNDQGPSFFPTFQSKIGRDPERCSAVTNFREYRHACLNSNTELVGWTSRVLYNSPPYEPATCDQYVSIDYGNTMKFDNLGIMSLINFQ